uniref:Disease resistance R13L4/SHOC-2-like LRR domain-containing protein n=1 Tax=Oryza punctata TaxID=4537 RepID=A0A0E0MGR2_ORYPU
MEVEDLDMIARLPALHLLRLYVRRRISWDVAGGGLFPSLSNYETSIALTFLPGAMPMLHRLVFWLRLSEDGATSDVGLGNLPLLSYVEVHLNCRGVTGRRVEEAEVALRQVKHTHPNSPAIREEMKRDKDDDDVLVVVVG